jgi:hypothetical protein
MSIRILIPALLIALLIDGCSPPGNLPAPTEPVPQQVSIEPTPEPTQTMTLAPTQAATLEVVTATPNCLNGEVSPIGQSIADEYDSVDYDQVMVWFCNGAEFEDILVALETESQTGTPAEEMLKMLAGGLTWDEIWQVIGLTEGNN